MDEKDVIAKFDGMVRDKIAFFDAEQQIVSHVEGPLTVRPPPLPSILIHANTTLSSHSS